MKKATKKTIKKAVKKAPKKKEIKKKAKLVSNSQYFELKRPPEKKKGILPVMKTLVDALRFNSQRDNKIDPYVTCFPTCCAMVVRTLENQDDGQQRKEFLRDDLDDVIIADIQNNLPAYKKALLKFAAWSGAYHPRTVYVFYEKVYFPQKMDGFTAKYASMTFAEMKEWIDENDAPVIVGTRATASGHMVCVVGYDDDGFIVNDPYGNAMTGYKDIKGREVKYPYSFKGWGMGEIGKYNCLLITRS